MKEMLLVRQIVDYLNLRGHFVQRTNSGTVQAEYNGRKRFIKMSKAGTADITGCTKDGKFLACEVKIKPNKPTELQKQYLEQISSRGGVAFVAYTLDDVINQKL